MDHSRAPVLQALADFKEEGHLPFIPPGHKQGRGVDPRVLQVLGGDVFRSDVIMMNGLDDRAMGKGVLSEAMALMADAVDADHAFFSTCGSSLSVKTCLITVARPGDKVLVSRNAHKSVIAGLIISGVEPVWVHPRWDARWQWAYPPGAEEVAAAFDRAPEAKGMLLITPTDYGTCAAIREVAEVCHERDRPLIVDEAWGAHLPFHPELPSWAMDAGADLCVTSVHKMGAGLEQGSVYHLQGDRVDPAVLSMRADLLDTTSPSSLVYAGLDGWRRQMVEHGHELLDRAIALDADARKRLGEVVTVVSREDVVGPGKADDHDPLKIVMDLSELGISGYDAADWLREHHRVDVGLSDHRRMAAQITVADDDGTVSRLVDAVVDLAEHARELPRAERVDVPEPGELELEQAMLPREAFYSDAEHVPAQEAVGRVCAETISPYPPGVPAALPGEVITQPVVDYVVSGRRAGMYLPDPTDSELKTIRVVSR
ncbi:aminotransferase class I/II-fold pyridoxal phosphate-dependent enzyme [Actinokineospora bangkokensis]|uniref:Ornithine decarboxylase n=1 Tax=Actinokineospora bangkokensis TaxID=1193682 RepID=A0A1Q9LNN5_9PSEU|nr:aminotransferase class I/II-fold pyridoxal phosphate-dependent enzyme [Actinokineospora bangkokensis]OLR93613.1 ornithine decarboxylase [Actinokineospora bangkokensis]